MKGNHTSGPWHNLPSYDGSRWIQGPSTDATEFRSIANIATWDIAERQHANANLIAAAPEMLEALELAEATIERLNRNNSANGTLDVIRSAIAKAHGLFL